MLLFAMGQNLVNGWCHVSVKFQYKSTSVLMSFTDWLSYALDYLFSVDKLTATSLRICQEDLDNVLND